MLDQDDSPTEIHRRIRLRRWVVVRNVGGPDPMPKPHVRSGTLTTRRKRQQREAKLLHDWFQREEARLAEQRAELARFVAERRLALPDDENCIDTVRLALREPPVMRDRVLLAKRGFELRKNWHRAFKHPDGSVSEPDPGCEHWHRERDDVRVFLWPPCASGEGRCAVEFELARLLGFSPRALRHPRSLSRIWSMFMGSLFAPDRLKKVRRPWLVTQWGGFEPRGGAIGGLTALFVDADQDVTAAVVDESTDVGEETLPALLVPQSRLESSDALSGSAVFATNSLMTAAVISASGRRSIPLWLRGQWRRITRVNPGPTRMAQGQSVPAGCADRGSRIRVGLPTSHSPSRAPT